MQNSYYAYDEKFLHHAEKKFAVHSRNPSQKQSDNSRSKAGNFHCREQDRNRQEKYSTWVKNINFKNME